MKRVYKYHVPIRDKFDLFLPVGWNFLKLGCQQDGEDHLVVMWILVDDNEYEREWNKVEFRVVGTGNPIEDYDDLLYCDSIEQRYMIWHLFFNKYSITNTYNEDEKVTDEKS